MTIEIEDILRANERIKDVVDVTPLQYNVNLSERYQADIYLKREDLQRIRSYKIRGAYNLMKSQDSRTLEKGVVCASAGNHAQGVAYSCFALQVNGTIFMPETTPRQKINQVRMFGKDKVKVILTGDTFDDAYEKAQMLSEEEGLLFIPPFDHEKIIEGQGTVGLEILQEQPQKNDIILIPVGGGGLSAGMGAYIKKVSPEIKLIGVEPAGAPAMYNSLKKGEIVRLTSFNKFVDGAAVGQVGKLPFEICKEILEKVVLVDEGKICSTIIELYNLEAIVVEPAGALTIAALDSIRDEIKGKTVTCVISGGNNDITRMQEIQERSLLYEGLKHYFIIRFPQRSGALRDFVDRILGPDDDIARFEFVKKNARESGPALVGVEVKSRKDYESLIFRMQANNINYTLINEEPNLFEFLI